MTARVDFPGVRWGGEGIFFRELTQEDGRTMLDEIVARMKEAKERAAHLTVSL